MHVGADSFRQGERRQATVLMADITGYSTLCTRMDPEQAQTLVSNFYELTDRVIANYGGYVIDHAGDATLAVFGAPLAHHDNSERSVRAALEMHAQAGTLIDPLGEPLRLHIGIASGEVVAATITSGATPKYVVTGEAVNLAARLDSLAQTGRTFMSNSVYETLSLLFSRANSEIQRSRASNKPLRCGK